MTEAELQEQIRLARQNIRASNSLREGAFREWQGEVRYLHGERARLRQLKAQLKKARGQL